MKKLRIILISTLFVLAFCMLIACGAPSLSKPENLEITNKTLTWDAVDNARGYTVEINGDQHDVRRTSYSFAGTRLEEGTYTFKVKARGNEIDFVDSEWATVTYVQGYESGILYALNDAQNAYIVKSVGTAKGDVVIEDTYNGLPVVAVGDFAFTNSIDTTSVVIGKNVTKIGARAFYGCTAMTSVFIPDCVTEIGEMAFQSCHSLTEVVVPFGVTKLPTSAFAYCKSLTEVDLVSSSVDEIGNSAFKSCESLESITIPEDVTSIGAEAFRNCGKLTSVDIKARSMTVGESTFRLCTSLTSVELGNCKTAISDSMFAGCNKLTKIKIPDTVTAIGNAAFSGCTALAYITIGKGVVSIGSDAFYDTAAIAGITDPIHVLGKWIVGVADRYSESINDDMLTLYNERKDIIGIADYAFNSCIYLNAGTVPQSVKYVGKGAFYNCPTLVVVVMQDNVESIGDAAFYGCENLQAVLMGRNVERIGEYAFAYCKSLVKENIIIYDKIKSIGTYAFYKTGIWENALKANSETAGVVYVGNWVVGCDPDKMGSVEVADGTVGLADYAFTYCSGLSSVSLPSSVKYIGEGAFYGCTGMYQGESTRSPMFNVNIPQGVTEIKPYTFYGNALREIGIPDSVTSIGYAAFGGCLALKEVAIPNSVTTMDSFAFWLCSSLESVTLGRNLTAVPDRAFSGCAKLKSIAIPAKVTSIGERAFYRCASLESVEFKGDLVETIGDKAFYMCSLLKSVSLPENVTEIGNYAFYKCESMSSIEFNDSLETIGDFAFYGCVSLKTSALPGSLGYVGNSAFRYCRNLSGVSIGRNVKVIGEHAFYGASNVTLYCEATSLPGGWAARWNSSYRPVVLGCTYDASYTYVAAVQKTDTSIYNSNAVGGIAPPKRAGYTFVGWALAPDATVAEYAANELASAPNGTLYSVWKEGEDESDNNKEENENDNDNGIEND